MATTTKSKQLFILDREDFTELRKLIEDIPGTEPVDAAELRLREARTAFLEHQHKHRTDGEAIIQAMATRVTNPRELEGPAREYHRALVEWCKLAAIAFESVHNEATDDVNSRAEQFSRWRKLTNSHPQKEARDAAHAEIQKIAAINAEPFRIMALAVQGRNAVKATFHLETGRSMQEANEDAFVKATDPLRKVA